MAFRTQATVIELGGSRLYLRCLHNDRIRVVNAATGATVRTLPDLGWYPFFATDGARIYLNDGSGLIAADATSGRTIWRRPFPDGTPDQLALAGGVLYALRGDGEPMQAFDARTGRLTALVATTAAITAQPMVSGARLYGVTKSGVAAYAPQAYARHRVTATPTRHRPPPTNARAAGTSPRKAHDIRTAIPGTR